MLLLAPTLKLSSPRRLPLRTARARQRASRVLLPKARRRLLRRNCHCKSGDRSLSGCRRRLRTARKTSGFWRMSRARWTRIGQRRIRKTFVNRSADVRFKGISWKTQTTTRRIRRQKKGELSLTCSLSYSSAHSGSPRCTGNTMPRSKTSSRCPIGDYPTRTRTTISPLD